MKNQSLTIAKLRKLLLVTALVICPLLLANNGSAQTATATLTSGGFTSIDILSGSSFSLTLAVTTNFASVGYTVFYQVSANGLGLFQANSRTNNNAFFGDAITSDGQALGNPAGILNPTNQFDLGYVATVIANPQPPGTNISLQTITFFASAMLAPGQYTIFLDNRSVMADTNFDDVGLGGGPMGTGPKFIINVIPEPTTVALAILGGAALFVVARRKIRA